MSSVINTRVNLLVAVPSLSITYTVISVADGLLKTSVGCKGPLSSLTLYVDSWKWTVISERLQMSFYA